MRTTALIRKSRTKSAGLSSPDKPNGDYKKRLTEWGCSGCKFFEARSFRTQPSSAEQDAYAICRFAGEPVDLIWEARACLKEAEGDRCKDQSQVGFTRQPNCRNAA